MLRSLKNYILSFKKRFFNKKYKETVLGANVDFNKKLVYSLSKSKIPTPKQLKYIGRYLTKKELFIVRLSILLIFFSLSFLTSRFYLTHLEVTPVRGGEYIEGLIGAPKHINPLYSSINDVDRDLSFLIFSSLYRSNGFGGLKEDLVETLSLSEDEKEYTIKLKSDVEWHDGEKLSADDVVFTFNIIADPAYQSPLRTGLSGSTITKIDDLTVKINLSQPYGAFRDLLTFGILPAHLWEQFSPESFLLQDLNLKPIGSGPYKFKRFLKDNNLGRIVSIELEPNDDYYGDVPYIEKLTFKFFPNFQESLISLNENIIDGVAYLPKELKEQVAAQNSINFHSLNFNQVLSLNFNSKENVALDKKNIRKALAHALNKEEIVNKVYSGNARVINSPILPESFAYSSELKKYDFNKQESLKFLEEEGWSLATVTAEDLIATEKGEEKIEKQLGEGHWMSKLNEDDEPEYLIINISTVDSIDNLAIANIIKKNWEEIGIKTIVKVFSLKEINGDIIRNRNFEALLYTQSLSFDPDVYSFWHSSQAVTGGNNISSFINGEVDRILSEGRAITNEEMRKEMYFEFQDILNEEVPAIFIVSPNYIYAQKKDVKNFDVASISSPSDRFSNISNWYINTGKKIIW